MRKTWAAILLAATLGATPTLTKAAIHLTDNADLTTAANLDYFGSAGDATGIWFNPLTGYAESRGSTYPSPQFADGQFWLLWNHAYVNPAAQINTMGFWSRGNDYIYESTFDLNAAKFDAGATIGAGSGYYSPGAGYPDLGPTFGNWAPSGGYGFIGLTMRNPAGATSSDLFYGYAEITVNPDMSITLHSFAYNDAQGQSLVTVSTVPEPSALALASVALGAMTLFRRRKV